MKGTVRLSCAWSNVCAAQQRARQKSRNIGKLARIVLWDVSDKKISQPFGKARSRARKIRSIQSAREAATGMKIEVVSVHFPKAAGSSLRRSFVTAYGEDAVFFDYADDPADPCSRWSLDPDGCRRAAERARFSSSTRVVHGHFHPLKYQFVKAAKRITFLRHPVDNLISIYCFWKTCSEGHCLFNYFRDNQLSLLDLARIPAIRHLFTKTYFSRVDMNVFDFIGFMENYAQDLQTLSNLLGVPLRETQENVNKHPNYEEIKGTIKADAALMAKLQDCLLEDVRFYEKLRSLRSAQ
ncbi:MAG TPA: sulfotransferase family 2 domain-containing protein [Methylomirabilota bacterium]|nr:sulfotransferase family 2 domain-containing protein [Methylomirabilota bacterium]